MKIVISSTGKNLNSEIDSRFGRCPYYLVVDIEAKKIEKVKAIKSKGSEYGHGAGFAAAQQVGDMGADCIITGNIGPNASRALQELGIKVYQASGTVKDAIEQLLDGKLSQTSQTVPGHSGNDAKKSNTSGKDKPFRKKLAIATENGEVALHFGRCPQFTVVEIEKGKVIKKEIVDNPGHQAGYLPKFLNDMGVNYMIAGAMGPMAQDYFKEYKINVIVGVQGKIDKVISDFIEDRIELGESLAKPGEGKGYGIDRKE